MLKTKKQMRIIFLFSFFLIVAVSANASIIKVSGDVSGTWDADTVQVIDDLQVASSQTLIINPGVKVIFDGYYTINISGQIQARGLKNDSISFFVSDSTGLHNLETNEGSWGGLWFEPHSSNSDSSTFEFCNFKYGKAISTDSLYWNGGAVNVREYSQVRFSNCLFSNNIVYKNGGAIYCKYSNILIEYCDFIDNSGGTSVDYGYGGAVCLEYSNAKIYWNYFTRNFSTGVGGGLSFEYSFPNIEGNIFYDNYSAIGGGLCGVRSIKGNSIVNNLFENNESTFFGGGVAFLETHAHFTNNTVVNNISMYGGGLYVNAGAKPIIKNCIVWNNSITSNAGSQVYIFDVYSAPEFYFNNIEGGFDDFSGSGVGNNLCVYDNNIDIDPQFVGNGDFPFGLSENSPCVNAGTPDTTGLLLPDMDLAGNIRFKEDSIDMGCYENQGHSGIYNLSVDDVEIFVFPNPVTNNSAINLSVLEQTTLEFKILDCQAKVKSVIPALDYSKGKYQIPLPIYMLNSGMYFLLAIENNSKKTEIFKFIVK